MGFIPTWPGYTTRGSLSKLPDDERQQWQQLWSDVDALLQRTRKSE